MNVRKLVVVAVTVLVVTVGAGLAFAPYVYTEMMPRLAMLGLPTAPASMIAAVPTAMPAAGPGPATGTALGTVVVGDRWRVQEIAPDTYAIGEPQNIPDNYEYLLVGQSRALLIDAGSTAQDIQPVLDALTKLPVTVIPTDLHFDHTNGLRNFRSIALIDLPETRSRVRDGMVHLSRYEYVGWYLPETPPVFRVTEWVKPDGWIDLGGRRLQVLWTPGHTATSISVWDPVAKLLFTGGAIHPASVYASLPDSSLSAYEATANRLLGMLPPETKLYGGHCCNYDPPVQAPVLGMNDLRDLRDAVNDIRDGKAEGRGFIVRRFLVSEQTSLITLYPFGNR